MTGPSLARAVDEHRETMRRAVQVIAMLTRENRRLHAELSESQAAVADRDEKIATLVSMIHRVTT